MTKHICNICGKGFSKVSHLKDHINKKIPCGQKSNGLTEFNTQKPTQEPTQNPTQIFLDENTSETENYTNSSRASRSDSDTSDNISRREYMDEPEKK